MGYKPVPLPNVLPSSPLPAVEEHLKALQAACLEALVAHELARQTMAARTRQCFTPFKKGEKVLLEARNLKRNIANPKFTPKREGSFTITVLHLLPFRPYFTPIIICHTRGLNSQPHYDTDHY